MPLINFKIFDCISKITIPVSYDASITVRNFILDFERRHAFKATTDKKIYEFLYFSKILN